MDRIKKYLILITLLCFGLTGFSQYEPRSRGERVEHRYYTLDFDATHRQASWVYYVLDLKDKRLTAERGNNFRTDPAVRSCSATPADYKGCGYDRGHLCPAADMAFSDEAMSETFYMSNMSPQLPAFNRGIWKKIEEKVRSWGKQEKIIVITGPVFRDNKGSVGHRVTVPGYYYKIVYSPAKSQMIAFLLPNEKKIDSAPEHFVVTVDSVEVFSGIDFFPQLADTLQNRLESHSDYRQWGGLKK